MLFHCSQKASHEVFITADEMSYNQANVQELQKISWCEILGILVWELLKELERYAGLISELPQYVGVHFIPELARICFMPELVMILDKLRDFV